MFAREVEARRLTEAQQFAHPLDRIECRAVARNREHHDEFIFETSHPDMPVAFVHRTWAVESDPTFPDTVGYPAWEAFRAAWTVQYAVWAFAVVAVLGSRRLARRKLAAEGVVILPLWQALAQWRSRRKS